MPSKRYSRYWYTIFLWIIHHFHPSTNTKEVCRLIYVSINWLSFGWYATVKLLDESLDSFRWGSGIWWRAKTPCYIWGQNWPTQLVCQSGYAVVTFFVQPLLQTATCGTCGFLMSCHTFTQFINVAPGCTSQKTYPHFKVRACKID